MSLRLAANASSRRTMNSSTNSGDSYLQRPVDVAARVRSTAASCTITKIFRSYCEAC
jgi:hypothetical protein